MSRKPCSISIMVVNGAFLDFTCFYNNLYSESPEELKNNFSDFKEYISERGYKIQTKCTQNEDGYKLCHQFSIENLSVEIVGSFSLTVE